MDSSLKNLVVLSGLAGVLSYVGYKLYSQAKGRSPSPAAVKSRSDGDSAVSRSSATLQLVQVSDPAQKVFDGQVFPLILSPSNESKGVPLQDVTAWIKENKASILEKLFTYGAVVFRGFPTKTPEDFNTFTTSFGFDALPYVGGAAPRTRIVGDVFTTNESPPEKLISFHPEMAQNPVYPTKLFFFCEIPAQQGGETPILLSHVLYRRLLQRDPITTEKMTNKGIKYIRVLSDGDDKESALGRGWQNTFATSDKAVAEERLKALGGTPEWLPNDCLKWTSMILNPVRVDPASGKQVWFNQSHTAYQGWNDKRNISSKAVIYGDGELLSAEFMALQKEIMNEIRVDMKWQAGDIMMINNLCVMHARNSFVPPRCIYAALYK